MNLENLKRALAPLWAALRTMFARAVVRNVNDAPRMQEVQVDLGNKDLRDRVEHWQPYGLTAKPQVGAEALVLFPSGDRSGPAAVLLVADRRYRIRNLADGEVALYTDEGVAITLKRNQVVRIEGASIELGASDTIGATAGSSITLTAPTINLDS